MKTLHFKKFVSLFFVAFLFFTARRAQVCTGDIFFGNQAQVDAFSCDSVMGNLVIAAKDITNLSALSTLTFVGGNLLINFTDNLFNVDGLSALTKVEGSLFIKNTPLENLDGLFNLTSVGKNMALWSSNSLTNIDGLSNLTSVGELSINGCQALININGLSSLKSVEGRINIYDCHALTNINGL